MGRGCQVTRTGRDPVPFQFQSEKNGYDDEGKAMGMGKREVTEGRDRQEE